MGAFYKSFLLFAMNWLDAQLTILWIRLDVATEGNALMAHLLELSESHFLSVKLIVGGFAAYILYRCSHLPLARRGMKLVLAVYLGLMVIHLVTGFSALGWEAPGTVLTYFISLPGSLLSLLA